MKVLIPQKMTVPFLLCLFLTMLSFLGVELQRSDIDFINGYMRF